MLLPWWWGGVWIGLYTEVRKALELPNRSTQRLWIKLRNCELVNPLILTSCSPDLYRVYLKADLTVRGIKDLFFDALTLRHAQAECFVRQPISFLVNLIACWRQPRSSTGNVLGNSDRDLCFSLDGTMGKSRRSTMAKRVSSPTMCWRMFTDGVRDPCAGLPRIHSTNNVNYRAA